MSSDRFGLTGANLTENWSSIGPEEFATGKSVTGTSRELFITSKKSWFSTTNESVESFKIFECEDYW